MPQTYPSPAAAPTSFSRTDRVQQAEALQALDESRAQVFSVEQVALKLNIPARTLRSWEQRRHTLGHPLAGFFERPEGVQLLHRILIAQHLVQGFLSPGGIRNVCCFLELTGLSDFIASSLSAQQRYAQKLRKVLIKYGDAETKRLAKEMPEKLMILAQDETFHAQLACLVAMELRSNFIFAEEFSPKRDAEAWNEVMKKALKPIVNGSFLSSSIDGGKALAAHVQDELGIEKAPDLFHVTYDAGRAVVAPLARAARRAEKEVEEAKAAVAKADAAQTTSASKRQGLEQARQDAEEQAAEAKRNEDEARVELRGISECFHLVNLETGALQDAAHVKEELTQKFEGLRAVAEKAGLSEQSLKGLDKAERVVPQLVDYMAFYQKFIALLLAIANLMGPVKEIFELLLAAEYMDLVAGRTGKADRRQELRERGAALRLRARQEQTRLGVGEQIWERVLWLAHEGASLFARSSSAVEGRNGRLRLWRYGQRRLSGDHLRALTVIHNFWIVRTDGTTAAERLFEQKPKSLWSHLLEELPYPPRAAKRRRIDPNIGELAA